MNTFLTPEEWGMVLGKTCQEARRLRDLQWNNPIRIPVVQAVLGTESDGTPMTQEARQSYTIIRNNGLIAGLHKGVPKPMSLSKIQEVEQGPKENPFAFLKSIFEDYQQYVEIDPE